MKAAVDKSKTKGAKMQLMREEVGNELESVQWFVKLAVACQKAGYLKGAEFFLTQAREDCYHAFVYARELDKYDEINDELIRDMTATEAIAKYYELEHEASKRTVAIKEQVLAEGQKDLVPFMEWAIREHSNEYYSAQKLGQQVAILEKDHAIKDIEDLFQEMIDFQDKDSLDISAH